MINLNSLGGLVDKALDTQWWRLVPYLKVVGSIPGQGISLTGVDADLVSQNLAGGREITISEYLPS